MTNETSNFDLELLFLQYMIGKDCENSNDFMYYLYVLFLFDSNIIHI